MLALQILIFLMERIQNGFDLACLVSNYFPTVRRGAKSPWDLRASRWSFITFNNNMRLSLMGIHCMLFSWSSQLAKKTSKAIFEPAVEFFFLISFYIKLSYTRANCCFMIVLRFCFQTTKIALGSKTSRDRRRLKA